MRYSILLLVLLAGCTTTSVEKQSKNIEQITSKIDAVKTELSNQIEQQNKQIKASLETTIAKQDELITKAADSNWFTIAGIQLVPLTERERTLLNGHAYATQEFLGVPSLNALKEAETTNKRLLDEKQTTIEQLKTELDAKKTEATQFKATVEAQKTVTAQLTTKLTETVTNSQKEIISLQDERAGLYKKLSNTLNTLLQDAESKKELAKYVLRITSIISGLLIVAAIVGAYFFKSPRFAAYCGAGSAIIFGFGWFFISLPPWLIVSSFIFIVIAIPAVLLHGYFHGKKQREIELTS